MQRRSLWSLTSLRVFLEDVVAARTRDGVLEPEDRVRVAQVVLAVPPPLVLPAAIEHVGRDRDGPGRRGGGASSTSAAISSSPMPLDLATAVLVKYSSMNSWFRPIASKICAPR